MTNNPATHYTTSGSGGNSTTRMAKAASLAAETVSTAAHKTMDGVDEVGRRLAGGFDQGCSLTSRGLHNTASSVREAGRRSAAAVTHAADSTADSIHATADSIGAYSARRLRSDLAAFVQHHPGKTFIGAVLLGFCIGRVIRRA